MRKLVVVSEDDDGALSVKKSSKKYIKRDMSEVKRSLIVQANISRLLNIQKSIYSFNNRQRVREWIENIHLDK